MSMTDLFSLVGRTALVTGANTGIGQGIALALANAGADIVAVGRTAPEETANLVRATGRRFHSIEADLGSASHSAEIVQQAVEHFGAVDILVNNAGIIRRADASAYSDEDWDDVLMVDLSSVFRLCRAVGSTMLDRGSGKIINIASMLTFQGGMRVPAYAAAKGGVAQLTKALANEWAARSGFDKLPMEARQGKDALTAYADSLQEELDELTETRKTLEEMAEVDEKQARDVSNYTAFMRYGFRSSLKADYCVHNLGFRCAKDL